ncbi:hypothetical protein NAEGRDRAFT_80711 [Naegleria gruberi]|uniref:Uncharacterized protein n=1 Tax=Naegleria gruberi TaxID=5762 RepID=D2VP51_NAEGR|nr:uncharacterized protein NAEGRDRAFT_80711 [Naegleria gruberi]EFC41297.1 hypothetical protein NAEGRDRAFT_80711 [Naegleria gruberi]|eukprot:XP_002674041.1 hypothetical protein NAEGRDRAFT_80711 [Naegleria gruberi strain NEG-M]
MFSSSSSSSSNNRRLPLAILFHTPPNPLIQQQLPPTLSPNVSSNSSIRINSPLTSSSLSSTTTNIMSNISSSTNSSIHTSTPSFSSSSSFTPSLNSLSFSSSNPNPLKPRSRSNSNSSSVSNGGLHEFVSSPTAEEVEIENDEEKRKRTKSMASLAKQLKKISNQPGETINQPISSESSVIANTPQKVEKVEETPSETIVVGLKRRVSSFLFRKSLNQETLSANGGSFRIPAASSPSRKSLNVISNTNPNESNTYTSSSPQFGKATVSNNNQSNPIQRTNSKTRSFFTSKKKKHQSMEHEVSSNVSNKKNRHSSSSNVAGMCESPDTGSLFSFDIGTVDATTNTTSNDNVSSTDADCISNFGGNNQKSLVLEDLEHATPEEMGNIDSMRVKFLQFISNEFVRNPNTKGLPENDFLVKLYFMDFMYDGISLKISRKLTNLLSILHQIDSLCKFLLTKFDKHSQLWREIIEDQATSLKYPYLECIVTDTIENDVQRMSQSYWLTHQRLCKFLKETYEVYVKNNHKPLEQLDENQSHSTNLKKQIQLLCDMFFIDLEDQFMLFQAKNYKYIKKWIGEGVKNKTIPNQVIEIYKRDREHNEKMQNEFKIQAEDFTTKHVIDKDWKFMKYFSNELSHHWFLTYSQLGKLANWNSFADFSSDNLNLRISKMIGYIDQPIEQVAKSFNYDNHLQYQFKNMKWSSYNTIDDSNSLLKYPSVLMSGVYESGSIFSSRNMQLVFSSKSSFVGEELTEMQTIFKSCETVKEKSKKDIIKIKMPLLGIRILLKIDENRTRVTELRFSNLGGFLNSKIVIFNPISTKKSCLETYNSLLSAIAAHEGKGMPSSQDNNLMRLWVDYCNHYAGINVVEKYKSIR